MAEKDIFDKVIDYIDAMSDEDFFNLVKECEEHPEFSFAIAEENSYDYLSVKDFNNENLRTVFCGQDFFIPEESVYDDYDWMCVA